ncbi:hypothetical protein HDE69_003534 [Pedobacter cryoconitis]|uniref:JmjC domain-containing protein n=1 Tax=Pedobacter cryoconitis TaxID=188932 RepID=A0A7W8YV96_9SPHI|nr:cupin-like domain-containing protein [Pedobacter cryoconitis]MBB5622459.1 hypothetical protein [Pedobacter cryoconitis]
MSTLANPINGDLEMNELCNSFFSVIPGIENAAGVNVVNASDLCESSFKRDWVSQNKPCLIKGAVKHWPAVKKWKDKDYWLSACENFKLHVYPHQNFNNQARHKDGREEMQFHDAIERLFQNQDKILSLPGEVISPNNRFKGIIKDLGGFEFLDPEEKPRLYSQRRFFIYRRAATAWHYHDADETLMCQVNGSKRVALLPPGIPQVKQITDFLEKEKHLEGEALDKELKLNSFIADVEEGDALYIPPYWHHGVVPTDGKIGFTLAYCWASPIHILGDFSNYFVRNLYRRGLWPIRQISIALPFIGFYAGLSHLMRKVFYKIH